MFGPLRNLFSQTRPPVDETLNQGQGEWWLRRGDDQEIENPNLSRNVVPVIRINVPGIGEAPQWVMDTSNAFLVSDWAGPQLPFTRKFCRTPDATHESFLLQTVPVVIEGLPQFSQIPNPMPLTLY